MDFTGTCYIGEAAKHTGASPKAIRMYEQMKLIPKPERRGTYRVYTDQHIERIYFIKQFQALGFKLAELKKCLAGKPLDCNVVPWSEIIAIVKNKIENNLSTISRLEKQTDQMKKFLGDLKNKQIKFMP